MQVQRAGQLLQEYHCSLKRAGSVVTTRSHGINKANGVQVDTVTTLQQGVDACGFTLTIENTLSKPGGQKFVEQVSGNGTGGPSCGAPRLAMGEVRTPIPSEELQSFDIRTMQAFGNAINEHSGDLFGFKEICCVGCGALIPHVLEVAGAAGVGGLIAYGAALGTTCGVCAIFD